jgi:hypothetical protein
MQNHEHFEELCALAAVGELSAAEHAKLDSHLGECSTCRETLRDMAAVTDAWIPATAPLSDAIHSLPLRSTGRLREKFLATGRDRGINLTRQSDRRSSLWMQWPFHMGRPFLTATTAVASVILITFFLIRVEQRTTRFTAEAHSLRAQLGDLERENASVKEKLAIEEQYRTKDQSTNVATAKELAALREQRDSVGVRASTLENEMALLAKDRDQVQRQLNSTRADLARMSQNYAAVNRDLISVQTELESARASSLEDRTLLGAQQKKIEELSQRPAVQNADLERDRQLLAADRDIRELMGARNLHIIDVHDRDSKGKPRRSFGRVFYTEGKSLIFYAFDLSDSKLKNASFQAWGHREDGSRKAVSLGLFYMDDKQQSRWVLRFNDPAVLAEIDSVFVTVEPPGGRKNPSGEKLLYAFLNFDANHP